MFIPTLKVLCVATLFCASVVSFGIAMKYPHYGLSGLGALIVLLLGVCTIFLVGLLAIRWDINSDELMTGLGLVCTAAITMGFAYLCTVLNFPPDIRKGIFLIGWGLIAGVWACFGFAHCRNVKHK